MGMGHQENKSRQIQHVEGVMSGTLLDFKSQIFYFLCCGQLMPGSKLVSLSCPHYSFTLQTTEKARKGWMERRKEQKRMRSKTVRQTMLWAASIRNLFIYFITFNFVLSMSLSVFRLLSSRCCNTRRRPKDQKRQHHRQLYQKDLVLPVRRHQQYRRRGYMPTSNLK